MIGRGKERRMLEEARDSEYSEFVAVYGRRRVGKTFLVRETFDYTFTFQHSGLANSGMKRQLKAFAGALRESGLDIGAVPGDWMDAFDALKDVIRRSDAPKKVVFIDEMPWMDTPKSGFVSALENFWNGWASARKDVLLIVCGSATSWIIKKILRNRGGLHNRVDELARMQRRRRVFTDETGTRKAVHLTLVVSPELKKNAYANDIQSTVTMDDLFRE